MSLPPLYCQESMLDLEGAKISAQDDVHCHSLVPRHNLVYEHPDVLTVLQGGVGVKYDINYAHSC